MAELTEEEKIVIGVCCAIAGLIVIGIIIFICCAMYMRDGRRRHRGRRNHRHIKERIIDDHQRDFGRSYGEGYNGGYVGGYGGEDYIKRGPPPMIVEPEPEYRERRWEAYDNKEVLPSTRWQRYEEPVPVIPAIPRAEAPRRARRERYDEYDEDLYLPIHKTYARETSREVDYEQKPIVIQAQEPEFVLTTPPAVEPETIYLKYHQDDMALLPSTRYYRRPAETRVIRRTRSFDDVRPMYERRVVNYASRQAARPRSKYVGEWGHAIYQPWEMTFNNRAAQAGRDPFLWSN